MRKRTVFRSKQGEHCLSDVLKEFTRRVMVGWLPAYQREREHQPGEFEFQAKSIKVSERDASDMMRLIDAGCLIQTGRGNFTFARSSAKEALFWEGAKSRTPRCVTLWIEPVITLAALARLHFDYGWPIESLGSQSKKWEFDVVAFETAASEAEAIAGEVKKSTKELDVLIGHLQNFAASGCTEEPSDGGAKNAFRKWIGLRDRKIPLFWAVGPDRHEFAFAMQYLDDGCAKMVNIPLHRLRHRKVSEIGSVHEALASVTSCRV